MRYVLRVIISCVFFACIISVIFKTLHFVPLFLPTVPLFLPSVPLRTCFIHFHCAISFFSITSHFSGSMFYFTFSYLSFLFLCFLFVFVILLFFFLPSFFSPLLPHMRFFCPFYRLFSPLIFPDIASISSSSFYLLFLLYPVVSFFSFINLYSFISRFLVHFPVKLLPLLLFLSLYLLILFTFLSLLIQSLPPFSSKSRIPSISLFIIYFPTYPFWN